MKQKQRRILELALILKSKNKTSMDYDRALVDLCHDLTEVSKEEIVGFLGVSFYTLYPPQETNHAGTEEEVTNSLSQGTTEVRAERVQGPTLCR